MVFVGRVSHICWSGIDFQFHLLFFQTCLDILFSVTLPRKKSSWSTKFCCRDGETWCWLSSAVAEVIPSRLYENSIESGLYTKHEGDHGESKLWLRLAFCEPVWGCWTHFSLCIIWRLWLESQIWSDLYDHGSIYSGSCSDHWNLRSQTPCPCEH